MLTFLSRSFRELLASARAEAPARRPISRQLRLVNSPPDRDTAVASVLHLGGAATFVAGQGARIYSLDAFRRVAPRRPRAA